MKRKVRMIVACMLMLAFSVSIVSTNALAEGDWLQVNGKYKITNTRLTTYCALASADSDFPKKTRTYKITQKTKFYWTSNHKKLTAKQRKKVIKRMNKKKEVFQFIAKKKVVKKVLVSKNGKWY